jgi:hypothetical protein
LTLLAEQHPLVSEALITISGSVPTQQLCRDLTDLLLEVLVATKITPIAGLDPASA